MGHVLLLQEYHSEKKLHSRRKPGSTPQRLSRRINGSRLSPGMRKFTRIVKREHAASAGRLLGISDCQRFGGGVDWAEARRKESAMVEIRRMGPQIGVEVRGVDVTTLDDQGFAPIYQ